MIVPDLILKSFKRIITLTYRVCSILLPQKATRKTDKIQPDELDVTVLTDQDLKDELLKHGVDVGPIVGECSHCWKQQQGQMSFMTKVTYILIKQSYDCPSYAGMWCVSATLSTQLKESKSRFYLLPHSMSHLTILLFTCMY